MENSTFVEIGDTVTNKEHEGEGEVTKIVDGIAFVLLDNTVFGDEREIPVSDLVILQKGNNEESEESEPVLPTLEEEDIQLVIKEKESIVEKAERLLVDHGTIPLIILDTPGIVESEKKITVNSVKSEKVATDCLGLTKGHLKVIEARRKICLKPFKMATDIINAKNKEITLQLNEVVDSVENKMRKYDDLLENEKKKADAEEMRKIEEAAANNKPLPAPAPTYTPPTKSVKTDHTTVSKVDNWKPEILDKNKFIDYAFETGQYEFIDINVPALNQLVKRVKNTRAIPGIKQYNHKSIPTRSK